MLLLDRLKMVGPVGPVRFTVKSGPKLLPQRGALRGPDGSRCHMGSILPVQVIT